MPINNYTISSSLFMYEWYLNNIEDAGLCRHGGCSHEDFDSLRNHANLTGWKQSIDEFGAGEYSPVIAVIDTGFDLEHPSFQNNRWICEDGGTVSEFMNGDAPCVNGTHGWNFTEGENNDNLEPTFFHGTAVAGIISSGNAEEGTHGVCPNCKIMFLKVPNSYRGTYLAIQYAIDNGVDIISVSDTVTISETSPSYISLHEAVTNAIDSGILYVNSAGNSGIDVDEPTPLGNFVNPPHWGITFTVSGIDIIDRFGFGTLNYFNYGLNVDIVTHGKDPGLLYPYTKKPHESYGDTWSGGAGHHGKLFNSSGINICDDATQTCDDDQDSWKTGVGTSYSTPLISGYAGLLLSHDNTLSSEDLINIIVNTGDNIDNQISNLTFFNSQDEITPDMLPPKANFYAGVSSLYNNVVIYGCMDESALNYNPSATIDDGSCISENEEIIEVYGCMNPLACNYNFNANINQGCIMQVEYCYDNDGDGLGDSNNSQAFCPNDVPDNYVLNCVDLDDECFSNIFDCTGTCNGDATINECGCVGGSTGLSETWCYGCTDSGAINYDPTAIINNGTCEYAMFYIQTIMFNSFVSTDLINDVLDIQYFSNSDIMTYAHLFTTNESSAYSNGEWSGDIQTLDLNKSYCLLLPDTSIQYSYPDLNILSPNTCAHVGCQDETACNYDNDNTSPCDNCCTYPITYYEDLDGDGLGNPDIFQEYCPGTQPENYILNNGDVDDSCTSNTYDCAGICDGEAFVNECGCVGGLTTLPETFCYGCTDPLAMNYNQYAEIDDDSCTYLVYGCMDETACNYNPEATQDGGNCTYQAEYCYDEDGDGYGAGDPQMFCPSDVPIGFVSNCDDPDDTCFDGFVVDCAGECNGSAFETECGCVGGTTGLVVNFCYGCMEVDADNYDPAFDDIYTINTGCIYYGCTDPNANNYDPIATDNDGSCTYTIYGCTNPEANNYNPDADVDDGSCVIFGCTDPLALNYNENATHDDGNCEYFDQCPNSISCINNAECSGLFEFNERDGEPIGFEFCNDDGCCEFISNEDGFGCTDVGACNYSDTAIYDNDSCVYTTRYCADVDGDGFGDASTEMFVCPGEQPDNYIQNCDDVDDSCISNEFDCAGICDGEAIISECGCIGGNTGLTENWCYGCTNELANNYDPNATIDNGMCVFGEPHIITISFNYFPGSNATADVMNPEYFVSPQLLTLGTQISTLGLATMYTVNGWVGSLQTLELNQSYCLHLPDISIVYTYEGHEVLNHDQCLHYGCTDPDAINYCQACDTDNGSCEYEYCDDPLACNFVLNPEHVNNDLCEYPVYFYYDGDGDGIPCDPLLVDSSIENPLIICNASPDTIPINYVYVEDITSYDNFETNCNCQSNIIDDCGICDGGNANKDCNGDCFGTAFIDDCDACVSGNTGLVENYLDVGCGCNQPPEQMYYLDLDGDGIGGDFGVLFCPGTEPVNWVLITGDEFPECITNDPDCFGTCAGDAFIDSCGNCVEGLTGQLENYALDCNNDCFGQAYLDNCGICIGGNTGNNEPCVQDCLDVWGGDAEIDVCGICDGPGDIYECGCTDILPGYCDCDGHWLDDCGDCNGNNFLDVDCSGTCHGDAYLSDCGCVSGTTGLDEDFCYGCTDETACNYDVIFTIDDESCEYPDCNDECYGGAIIDECGVCDGDGAIYECGCNDIPDGDCDCEGSVLDECDICGGDGSTCVGGCTNPTAINYNPDATWDDGSCTYSQEPTLGCTDPRATNYDIYSTVDIGTCVYNFDIDDCCNIQLLSTNSVVFEQCNRDTRVALGTFSFDDQQDNYQAIYAQTVFKNILEEYTFISDELIQNSINYVNIHPEDLYDFTILMKPIPSTILNEFDDMTISNIQSATSVDRYYDNKISLVEYDITSAPVEITFLVGALFPLIPIFDEITALDSIYAYLINNHIELTDFKLFMVNLDFGDGSDIVGEYNDPSNYIEMGLSNPTAEITHKYENSGIYTVSGLIMGVHRFITQGSQYRITFAKNFKVKININDNDLKLNNEFTEFGGLDYLFIPYGTPHNNITNVILGGISQQSTYYKSVEDVAKYGENLSKFEDIYDNTKLIKSLEALSNMNYNKKSKTLLNYKGELLSQRFNNINNGNISTVQLYDFENNNQLDPETAIGYFVGELLPSGDLDITQPVYLIHTGEYNELGELGESFGQFDVHQSSLYVDKIYNMWELLGFTDEELDNPNNIRYWKNIIPDTYTVVNRNGIINNDIDIESNQNWHGEYYYPVLPKINQFGNFDETLGLQQINDVENIPFGSANRQWDGEDLDSIITNKIDSTHFIFNLYFDEFENNFVEDSSGNENVGVIIGDYSLSISDGIVDKNGDMKEPIIGKDEKVL